MTEAPPWTDLLPSGWSALPLRHVAAVRNSNVDKKSYDEGVPVRLCNYTDVYYNEYITSELELMAATATPSEVQRFELRAGDVIITKDSESWNDIAVPAAVKHDMPGVVCGYHLTMFRPNPGVLYGPYLLRALQADGVREQFWLAANGVTRFGIGQQGMKDARIPVPPLPIQRRIADFLDRKTAAIDALIEKKERLLALLAEKRAALIHRAVTKGLDPGVPMKDSGVPWVGEVPEHWEVVLLRLLARIESGHTPSRSHPEYWVRSECTIPWFALSDVWQLRDGRRTYLGETSEMISETGMANSAARLLPAGTVVLSRTASVGFSGIMPRPMATTQDFVNWVCGDRVIPKFMLWMFRSMKPEFDRLMMGSTHQTIYMPDVRQFRGPLPPVDEQRRLVRHIENAVERLDRIVDAASRQIAALRDYRQAIITAAVTGQLDPHASTDACLSSPAREGTEPGRTA